MKRFKVETGCMKGAPECMRISDFMNEVNNPELTKRLNEHVPKTMEEMMITTTAFIRGEVGAAKKRKVTHHEEYRTSQSGKLQKKGPTFKVSQGKEGGLAGLPPYKDTKINSRGRGRKVLAITTYGDPSRKKRTSQSGKLQKKGPTFEVSQGKEGGLAGLPPYKDTKINSRGRGMKVLAITTYGDPSRKKSSNKFCDFHNDKGHSTQKVTQSFERVIEITFPSLETSSGTEVPLVIEAKIGEHMIQRMTTQALGNNRRRRSFHKTWMNFMIIRSLSPYNGITGRPEIKEIHAVPSTTHGMLKFPADGGIVTIRSTILIPAECATVITSSKEIPKEASVRHENFEVALHLNFPDQEVEIGGTYKTMLPPEGKLRYIRMEAIRHDRKSDEEKTTFHTSQGVYCYTKMPFGLKNADITYQRLVDKAFDSQTGRNIEVYVDDLVIKSYTEAEMLRDIGETFRTLRKINMKLNPKKCTFRVVEGMFLGYMITPKGKKPCPDKTEDVLQLPSLRTIKEVQSLNGKLASLNRFLFKSVKKYLPLFKALKICIKKSDFHWTSEAEQAFKQLKQHLSELPRLVAPKPKEELILYMSASYGAISAVLMIERGMVQMPVYFISHTLQGPELNYTPMEKLVLSLVFAAKRLQRNFQVNHIAVLADFLAEMPNESQPDTSVVETQQESWTLFMDGSSCVDGSGAGLILTSPEGTEFIYALRFQFTVSNNEAKYEALIAGLRIAAQMGVQNVQVSIDSKLVANQVLGAYVAKEENMIKYLEKVKSLVLVEILKEKSIQEKEVTTVVEEDGPTWMTSIIEYLKEWTFHSDRMEARKLRIKARPGDFVCHSYDASHAVDEGKLSPKWEGPYEVTKALGDGAYKLRSTNGRSSRGHGMSPI
uniref:Reverse transcriptase domain-containing protein n=1 Tax=Tanacetum cinerariifolium TaxID=118510 RepID=A0A6L2MBA0_TANCI|nr:reverse transcriptase domain-containing protein [Tanacetum cinerariifolium]